MGRKKKKEGETILYLNEWVGRMGRRIICNFFCSLFFVPVALGGGIREPGTKKREIIEDFPRIFSL